MISGTSGTFSDTRSHSAQASSALVVYDSLASAEEATSEAGVSFEARPIHALACSPEASL